MKIWISILMGFSLLFGEITLPKNFQSDFIQTITNPKKQVITYEGTVRFSDQKYFKWTYQTPTQKEVCTDGKELLVVDHDLEQVSAYLIKKGLDVIQVLKGAKVYKQNIYTTIYEGKQYTIQVDAQGKLQSMAYYDDLDNKVQILFVDMKYGTTILSKERMRCNYPVGYDRIEG
jgi:outer membrane lipoprotein carrier protein